MIVSHVTRQCPRIFGGSLHAHPRALKPQQLMSLQRQSMHCRYRTVPDDHTAEQSVYDYESYQARRAQHQFILHIHHLVINSGCTFIHVEPILGWAPRLPGVDLEGPLL